MLSSQVKCISAHRAAARPVGRVRPGLGFTLIEVLVVVVIIGILATIAYPSYRSQVSKTRRADAQAVLMQDAQFMERAYTENGCYNAVCTTTGGVTTCACNGGVGSVSLPFQKSPIDGTASYYVMTLQSVAATAFTLLATPNPYGPEARAGSLTLDNTGTRGNW